MEKSVSAWSSFFFSGKALLVPLLQQVEARSKQVPLLTYSQSWGKLAPYMG